MQEHFINTYPQTLLTGEPNSTHNGPYIVLGNPPFSKPGKKGNTLASKFIEKAASFAEVEYIAFILLSGFKGQKLNAINKVGVHGKGKFTVLVNAREMS